MNRDDGPASQRCSMTGAMSAYTNTPSSDHARAHRYAEKAAALRAEAAAATEFDWAEL